MKRPTGFASEAELAAAVVAHLRAEGFEVYQEVEGRGGIADIVAVREGCARVIECKLLFGPDVLGQAWGWSTHAHELCVAAPPRYRGGRGGGDAFLRAAARELGIGIYEVSHGYSSFGDKPAPINVRLVVEPKPRACGSTLLASLRPEHQTYAAAGSPTGHRWTKFRESERNLVAHVRANPGVLGVEALKAIQHHWRGRSGPSRVYALIRSRVITAIRFEESPEGFRLFPVVEAPAVPELGGTERLAAAAIGAKPPRRRRRRRKAWRRGSAPSALAR